MRTFLVILTAALIALVGGVFARPDLGLHYWLQVSQFVGSQLATEMTTLEQVRSGEIKLGTPPPAQKAVATPAQAAPKPSKLAAAPAKKQPPPVLAASPANPPPAALEPLKPEAISPAGGASASPEQQLGGILKREKRENQVKEETFWTEERIQEALKNGEPSSKGSACLAFCDKKNTVKEINTP